MLSITRLTSSFRKRSYEKSGSNSVRKLFLQCALSSFELSRV
jgi:hypothetical protein